MISHGWAVQRAGSGLVTGALRRLVVFPRGNGRSNAKASGKHDSQLGLGMRLPIAGNGAASEDDTGCYPETPSREAMPVIGNAASDFILPEPVGPS